MFRILESQMALLGALTRRRFVSMMTDYIEQHFTSSIETTTREGLEAWVSGAVAKAEHYGITTEPEVAQLVLLLLVLGAHADMDEGRPWVHEALADRDLAGRGKVRKLIHLARTHGVEGVEQFIVVREVIQP